MKLYRTEKDFEDGEILGYYYQLVKGHIFWKGYFCTDNRRNRIDANIGWFKNKNSAREKLLAKISDYHFSKMEMRKGAKYDRFTT